MIDPALLANRLGARFGIDLSSESSNSGSAERISLRVAGIGPPNGFCIEISLGWRSIDSVFVPDPFASGLIKALCVQNAQRRSEFSALAAAFVFSGTKCLVRIDDRTLDSSSLPEGDWGKFELSCSRLSDMADKQQDVEKVAAACLALLLSLLPVDYEVVEFNPLAQGLPEGAVTRVTVNRYERSPTNRAAAIAIHGSCCQACDFDFESFYGKLGEGFIEVHHRTPVSSMGDGYVVDPAKDLVPLCANCHQMVHREDPPIPVENLRANITARKNVEPKQ